MTLARTAMTDNGMQDGSTFTFGAKIARISARNTKDTKQKKKQANRKRKVGEVGMKDWGSIGFAQLGWQCPICKRVYSPMTLMCYYCSNGVATTSTSTTLLINNKDIDDGYSDKELLKEQDAVEPILIREGRNKYYNDYVCPRCGNEVVYEQNYCSECGVRFLWKEQTPLT